MQNKNEHLLKNVEEYYTSKVTTHGATPEGVDWNGEQGQTLRFAQLCKVLNPSKNFSINDLGCGYGALYEHLSNKYAKFSYHGNDISKAMIKVAQEKYADLNGVRFSVSNKPDDIADYTVASGIFNVKQDETDKAWSAYIQDTIEILDQTSQSGFAFNCLTSFSDPEKMRENLYYANPMELFELCKQKYSRNVALLHDYDLYEFTILVKK